MGWYYYADRGRRRNIFLRAEWLSEKIKTEALKVASKGEIIDFVKVIDRDKQRKTACLQFWCRKIPASMPIKHTVFILEFPEDPEWVCQAFD